MLRRPIVGRGVPAWKVHRRQRARHLAGAGGFALGLVGFSVYLFVLRVFYAHQDARTPFIINVGENVLNIVLALAVRRSLGAARPRPVVRARVL